MGVAFGRPLCLFGVDTRSGRSYTGEANPASTARPYTMPRQVVTIGADGSVSGLQVKPGKGFDLRTLGPADIKRASEIEWDIRAQAWLVGILRGRYAGNGLSPALWSSVGLTDHPEGAIESDETWADAQHLAYRFTDYDTAVAAEIAFLDRVRLIEGAAALT